MGLKSLWRKWFPKYRIVKVAKEGYFLVYRVEERFLLFLWDFDRAFDTEDGARYHIKSLRADREKPWTKVIHKE